MKKTMRATAKSVETKRIMFLIAGPLSRRKLSIGNPTATSKKAGDFAEWSCSRTRISALSKHGPQENDEKEHESGKSKNGGQHEKGEDHPTTLRQNLVRLISEFTKEDVQIGPIKDALMKLESLQLTPATPEFSELALFGDWRLLYSSLGTMTKEPFTLEKTVQRFDTAAKRMTNQVDWEFPAKNGINKVNARLQVICEYSFVGPSRLNIKLLEHKVTILPRQDSSSIELPDDMKIVIDDLRRTIPIEFFDPSGLCDISYIEPEYRVSRFLGKRVAGVREIFFRIPPDAPEL